ncbi:uncharacterized protein PG998_007160 [Apiospora kogelbergensis]|uniref:uncharacterized protein n=1 Tax=Apiospora kogelbergensis TaxID=1337665 RepID=UPI0031305981
MSFINSSIDSFSLPQSHPTAVNTLTPHHKLSLTQWGISSVLGLLLLTIFTRISSTIQFRRALSSPDSKEVPVVPYWIPGLYHAFALWDPAAFAFSLSKKFGPEKPLQVKAGWLNFFLLSNPEHIKEMFRKSRLTTNTTTVAFTLRSLVNLPLETVSLYLADNSGAGLKPRKDSNVAPERRITYLVSHHLHKFLSGIHLNGIATRYSSLLSRRMGSIQPQGEWESDPDLFGFLQRTTLAPEIEAMFGVKLLELNPGFIDDILIFAHHVPEFLRLRPKWLILRAHRARQRLIQNVMAWHNYAEQHVGFDDVSEEDPDWDPVWGSRLLRVRQQYERKTGAMDAEARACEDMGLIWAATANVQNTVFWFFFEALRDPDLKARLLSEISECKITNTVDGTPMFDMEKLTSQPLLQSMYAEVLRLYVGVAVSRIAGYEDVVLGKYKIPRDSLIMTYSRAMSMDAEAWVRAGRTLRKPLEEFDAERFLVGSDWARPGAMASSSSPAVEPKLDRQGGSEEKLRFTLDGLLGLWVPFGGGDHMCPGRHLAKQQMLVTFALLLSEFDMEISGDAATVARVKPDMKFAPFGSLPPASSVGFRIKKRQPVDI